MVSVGCDAQDEATSSVDVINGVSPFGSVFRPWFTYLCSILACTHLFGKVLVPHGGQPASLTPLGKRAHVQDAQNTAAYAQLVLQDEAILGAQGQAWSQTPEQAERFSFVSAQGIG